MSLGPDARPAPSSTRISPPRTRTACGSTAPAIRQGRPAAVPDQGALRRADPHARSTTTRRSTARRTAASAATRRSCTSTTPTTARRATAPPAPTTSPARSTTTCWGTTLARRDTDQHRPHRPRASGPTAMAAWSRSRATSASPGHALVPRPPLLLHRRERLQGQLGMVNITAASIAATRRSTTASTCGCRAAGCCDWGNLDFDVN